MATTKESLTDSAWFITHICTSGIFMNFACALEVSFLSTLVLNDAVVQIALGLIIFLMEDFTKDVMLEAKICL